MTRRTSIVAATVFAATLSLTACGGDDKKDAAATTTTASASGSASQSPQSAPQTQPTDASYMKNGKVNPLAVTQDNVNEVCTKLLGDPSKTYANIDAYDQNATGDGYAPIKDTKEEDVTGWFAMVTKYYDQRGNYVNFTCAPETKTGTHDDKPSVSVTQYIDGDGVNAKTKMIPNPTFGVSPNYDRIVDGKVYVGSAYTLSKYFAWDEGLTSAARYVTKGLTMTVPGGEGTVEKPASWITEQVKRWSAENVKLIKPLVDKAADGLTAG